MLSYSMFFGDNVMLTRECFSGGRYIGLTLITTLRSVVQSVFLALGERIKRLCNDIFCSTRRVEFTGEI